MAECFRDECAIGRSSNSVARGMGTCQQCLFETTDDCKHSMIAEPMTCLIKLQIDGENWLGEDISATLIHLSQHNTIV
ncbi:hypothetical protein A2U01_0009381 [Trifolium medium]|uniref:Uncharacterized protein n=1 Tax=Trifolium medium TaxID=97028 RepID=A0A392MLT6_9FABA|nr:hypothetical protein [Trifolium medium]